jgi:hypothetical protein
VNNKVIELPDRADIIWQAGAAFSQYKQDLPAVKLPIRPIFKRRPASIPTCDMRGKQILAEVNDLANIYFSIFGA